MNVQPAVKKDREMSAALDDHNGVHPAPLVPSAPVLAARGPGRALREDLVGEQTHFSGEGRVAQVLRWVSTATLMANDPAHLGFVGARRNAARTPEVQASAVGGRLLLGTNATNDSHIPTALHDFLHDSGRVTAKVDELNQQAAAMPTGSVDQREAQRLVMQQSRHLHQLHRFITDDRSFQTFSDTAAREVQTQAFNASVGADNPYQAFHAFDNEKQITTSTLHSIRSSLNRKGGVEMAPNTQHQHAEQRIIEHIQTNNDREVSESLFHLGFEQQSAVRIPAIVAGTKPPCDMCETTERARDSVARGLLPAAQSRLFVRRYEDPTYETGPLFPGTYRNTLDHSVRGAITAPGFHGTAAEFPAATVAARKRADSFSE